MLLEGSDTPFSAEFTVTLNVLHFREETENRFRATYASFCHEPDDPAEMERVLSCQVHTGASWNGWALARDVWQLPLRRRDSVLSSLLQQQADEAIARLPPLADCALDVRRVLASTHRRRTIRASRQLLGRLARRRDHSSDALLLQVCLIGNWSSVARKDAAERYLSDSCLSIGEIAYFARLFGSCGLQQGVQTMAPSETTGVPSAPEARAGVDSSLVRLTCVRDTGDTKISRTMTGNARLNEGASRLRGGHGTTHTSIFQPPIVNRH